MKRARGPSALSPDARTDSSPPSAPPAPPAAPAPLVHLSSTRTDSSIWTHTDLLYEIVGHVDDWDTLSALMLTSKAMHKRLCTDHRSAERIGQLAMGVLGNVPEPDGYVCPDTEDEVDFGMSGYEAPSDSSCDFGELREDYVPDLSVAQYWARSDDTDLPDDAYYYGFVGKLTPKEQHAATERRARFFQLQSEVVRNREQSGIPLDGSAALGVTPAECTLLDLCHAHVSLLFDLHEGLGRTALLRGKLHASPPLLYQLPRRLHTLELARVAIAVWPAILNMYLDWWDHGTASDADAKEACALAVQKKAEMLTRVPHKLQSTAMCVDAVSRNPKLWDEVATRLRTDAFYTPVISIHGALLRHVPDPSTELCRLAVAVDPDAIRYVPHLSPPVLKVLYSTPHCWAARRLARRARYLKYVSDHQAFRKTLEELDEREGAEFDEV